MFFGDICIYMVIFKNIPQNLLAVLGLMVSLMLQPDTFADFEVMTDRLVAEVLYHIEMYGMNPRRVR